MNTSQLLSPWIDSRKSSADNWSERQWCDHLTQLELALNLPKFCEKSAKAKIIGFGEISTILQFNEQPTWVFKRMPIFDSIVQAKEYQQRYCQYNQLLSQAGINIADGFEVVTDGNPVALYLIQQAFQSQQIGNRALHAAPLDKQKLIIGNIFQQIEKIFLFNQQSGNEFLLSCDGQVSNWAINESHVYYIDTSTPLYKKNGVEKLEYELLLKSTPRFMRGIIRRFFLKEVLERYYHKEQVYMDLIANLYKEKLVHLVPIAIKLANKNLKSDSNFDQVLNQNDVKNYYSRDKLIWRLFLALRKIDRWLHRYVWRKPYQYLLPDKIER